MEGAGFAVALHWAFFSCGKRSKRKEIVLTTLCTLASGSSGNATLISCGSTHILIDAGISVRRINSALKTFGMCISDLSALLITHSHSDHVSALTTYLKHYTVPIYASDGTAFDLRNRFAGIGALLRPFAAGSSFSVGDFSVRSFPTAHDAGDSVCYRLDSPDGAAGILTDTGYVTDSAAEALCGVSLLVLESNHDIETLKGGPYPGYLKQRILGSAGHLSNDDAARFAVAAARWGARDVLLAHLSHENNTPAMALHTVRRALDAEGYQSVALSVAPRSECSGIHTL